MLHTAHIIHQRISASITDPITNPDIAATELLFHAVHHGLNQQLTKTSSTIKVRELGNRMKIWSRLLM